MARPDPYSRIKPLQRAMAEAYAADYCNRNNLSIQKLRSQKFEVIVDQMIFAQPTGVQADGLRNDIATRPFPTLILQLDEHGRIKIETTEYTQKYLGKF